MKKLNKFFCMLLALAMLLTSTVALAEGAAADLTMQTLTLNDIQVSMNDTPVLDLSGLSLSMGGAMDPETGKGAAQLSLLGGDQAAASVNTAWDSSKAVLTVDGLSKPLTLDIEALLAQMFSEENLNAMLEELLGSLSEDELAALKELFEAISECASEENLNATMEGFETYMATVSETMMSCMSEPVAETHKFQLADEADAQHITMNVGPEAFSTILDAAFAFYDSNPAFIKVLNAIMKLDGSDEQLTSFADLYAQVKEAEELNFAMNMDVYASDDGANVEVLGDMLLNDEQICAYEVLVCAVDESNMVVDVTVTAVEDGDEATINFNLSATASEVVEGETEYSIAMSVDDGVDPVSISAWFGPDADFGYMGTLNIIADGENVGMAFAESDTQNIFTIYTEDTSVEVGYVSRIEGLEAGDGLVYLTVTEGEDSYEVTAAVRTTTSTISVAEIDEMLAAEGIDVMTISEEDISTLSSEVMMVAMEALGVLGQNVPGLAELLGE